MAIILSGFVKNEGPFFLYFGIGSYYEIFLGIGPLSKCDENGDNVICFGAFSWRMSLFRYYLPP
jgi:hypothetical protein